MRETILSNAEKHFLLEALKNCKRLDGRMLNQYRSLTICYGKDWGTCYVSLGDTKTFVQIFCDVQEPKPTRPNEGLLYVNVELSPMAAPHFEIGTRSELNINLNRMLEKCIKDSKAVDLESLCIIADEKVWALHVNVSVLNHEGNLIDCVSVAALAALCHFRRPDTTVDGHEVIIHSAAEKDLLPIGLHHYPLCVSFAFNHEETIIADPSLVEEKVAKTVVTLCLNGHRELCGIQLSGAGACIESRYIVRCSTQAALRAKEVVAIVKSALQEDLSQRESGVNVGLTNCVESNKITTVSQDRLKIQLPYYNKNEILINKEANDSMAMDESVNQIEENEKIINLGENSAEIITECPLPKKKWKKKPFKMDELKDATYGEGGQSSWEVPIKANVKEVSSLLVKDDINTNVIADDEIVILPKPKKIFESVDICDEEVFVMSANDLEMPERVTKNQMDEKLVEVSISKLKLKKLKKKKSKA